MPSDINLASLSVEDLNAELERRRQEKQKELLEQIKAKELELSILRSQLAPQRVSAPKERMRLTSMTDRTAKILKVIDAAPGATFTASFLQSQTGLAGKGLTDALSHLVATGSLVRQGKARGTTYKVAEAAPAGAVDPA